MSLTLLLFEEYLHYLLFALFIWHFLINTALFDIFNFLPQWFLVFILNLLFGLHNPCVEPKFL